MAVYSQDNEVQIEFVRISDNRLNRPQIVTELIVDHLSTDIFQVICKLNNVNNLKTLKWIILSQTDGHLGLRIQNFDSSHTKSYKKPDLYSNVLGWTAIGRFDKLTSNSRHTTLGASRPVSSFNCTDARKYQCMSFFVDYNSKRRHGDIHKELNIQVTPADIKKEMLDESSGRYELTTIVHVGQTLRLQCTANIGSFKTSVKMVWMKSSLQNGGQLAPFSSGKQIVQEPKAFGSCEFDMTDTLFYNVSQEDALRTSDNDLQFQCFVHITSIDWKTPEKQRQNFHFLVYSNDENTLIQNETKTKEITANTTIMTGIIGGVCALVILGAAGMFWKRKYAYQGVQKTAAGILNMFVSFRRHSKHTKTTNRGFDIHLSDNGADTI
ncbi:uncharacterized protein LOC128236029 isoform X2 [Mya arenaria]|uniref:uncharacterized protein LOC128236029 isoform X2 n=1 Tax=Mya arenaria TaxID=6604 RepID=UPI0022DF2A63|nr:uncharacterized protein LOC128236029 isoform X2 [Mya arenaria]XP_052806787.1 uncharacterized protein LOC128236029 isoform X2 [Mya arenaria]